MCTLMISEQITRTVLRQASPNEVKAGRLVDRLKNISSLKKCEDIETELNNVKTALQALAKQDPKAVADALVWYLIKLDISQGFRDYKHWYFTQEKVVLAEHVLYGLYKRAPQAAKSGIVSIFKTIDKAERDRGISAEHLRDAVKFKRFLGARITAESFLHELGISGYEAEVDCEYTLNYPED